MGKEDEDALGQMDHEPVARRNSKYLGYTAGEVAKPAVSRAD